MGGGDPDKFKEISRASGLLFDAARRVDGQAMTALVIPSGFDLESLQRFASTGKGQPAQMPYPPRFVQSLPAGSLCDWNVDDMLSSGAWPPPFKAPAIQNVGEVSDRAFPFSQEIALCRASEIIRHGVTSNLEGFVFSRESFEGEPLAEFNAQLISQVLFNPSLGLDVFFRGRLARFYGGEEPARKLRQILELLENEAGARFENLSQAVPLARQAMEAAEPATRDRWAGLIRVLEALGAGIDRNESSKPQPAAK